MSRSGSSRIDELNGERIRRAPGVLVFGQLAATPVARYAVLVFLLAAAARRDRGAVTLDRNARRSSLAGAHDRARRRRPRRRLVVRVAAREPARAGDPARDLAAAAARGRDRRRGRAAPDRRRSATRGSTCAGRTIGTLPRVAADHLDGHDHRRRPRPRDGDDSAAARRRGADAAAPGDAAAPARARSCSSATDG